MPNFSNITISGHLGRDAERKQVGASSVCEFSIAVTSKKKDGDSTAWYRCTIWGKRGDSLAPHLAKGTAVIVGGEFMPREFDGKDGGTRTSLEVNVSSFSFAGSKADGGSSTAQAVQPALIPNNSPQVSDDSIPF